MEKQTNFGGESNRELEYNAKQKEHQAKRKELSGLGNLCEYFAGLACRDAMQRVRRT